MEDTALDKKNKISAYLFLITAILTLIGGALSTFYILAAINPLLMGAQDASIVNVTISFLVVFCIVAAASQIAAFFMIKGRSKNARVIAFAAFLLTLVTFTPLALVLIYPLIFLLGKEGKNFYGL